MRFPIVADIMLFLAVALTVFAAFQSQKASNDVRDNQDELEQITVCNERFLNKTIIALNDRTEYVLHQTRANVKVQKAQADFFSGIYAEPLNDELEFKLFKEYLDSLTAFVEASDDLTENSIEFAYPSSESYQACLDERK